MFSDYGKTSTVSIHTPIQGVTLESFGVFNTRLFQSTHPYRV